MTDRSNNCQLGTISQRGFGKLVPMREVGQAELAAKPAPFCGNVAEFGSPVRLDPSMSNSAICHLSRADAGNGRYVADLIVAVNPAITPPEGGMGGPPRSGIDQ
jgi:hypothetical protein